MKKKLNLYLHIPYCRAKCRFCNFFVLPGRLNKLHLYFEAMKKELETYKDRLEDYSFETIYVGGGTPSVVEADYVTDVISFIKDNFNVDVNAEISLEANPETVTLEKMTKYKEAWVNRLSRGFQAWQNKILAYLGRLYKIEEFQEALAIVKEVGFTNFNLDLIFGIPGQTYKDWDESLENIINCNPSHISCYTLEVDEDSIFGRLMKMGRFEPVSEKVDRKMYKMAVKKLKENGYSQYEISNFAKPGFHCRHNYALWNDQSYIGIGASAHSRFENKRYNNVYSLEKYIDMVSKDGSASENIESVRGKQRILEFILLHLRLIEGINLKEFKAKFKKNIFDLYSEQIENLVNQKLIKVNEEKLVLTNKGFDLENLVSMEFI